MGRHTDIQRHDTGGGEEGHLFASPVIIPITAVFIIPQIVVHGGAAVGGFLAKQSLGFAIAFQGRNVCNGAFQFVQEGVEINGDELGGADAGKAARIA